MQKYDPLEFAQSEVTRFEAELLDQQPSTGTELCEKSLLKGIQVFAWIELAEEVLIVAENDCLVDYSLEVHDIIHNLYQRWIVKCEAALAWAAKLQAAGLEVGFYEELVANLVRAKEWLRIADELRQPFLSHEQLHKYAETCRSASRQSVATLQDHVT